MAVKIRKERDLAQSLKLLWVGGGAGIGNLVLPSTNAGSPKEEDLQVPSSSGSEEN